MPLFLPSRRTLLAVTTAAAFSSLLAGCQPADTPAQFSGSDISDTNVGNELSMVDTQGTTRTLADFKGKVTVFFFGFTQCPDVCPTAMAELSQVVTLLGDQADQVQVAMISVDPERDTPEILGQYVHTFNPGFIGLTGSLDQLEATARSFKAYYAKVKGAKPGEYSMDHASSFYIFDKNAKARVLVSGKAPAADIAADIRQLL